ncbi:PREDICTED: uncharacterized protein LOC109480122 [Branchiostoma belcheri]|uniref:Uncharacterized protein LOC109480122 n=1 Tax=Branchiostoma belcheri TaxID=7741 RepID=A0A6P4ZM39_BRABE|nr:PREDICTED: uncharacterized protein LOC109480122 [Branchiostoma belcheri]
MADEDSAEKPPDAAPDDTTDPPVQPVKEEEVGKAKETRVDSIHVDTIDGPPEEDFSSGKSSGCCRGGCPVLTVIIFGILVGNALGLLLVYQRIYSLRSTVKLPKVKATVTPSVAPTANQRRRSISEEVAQEIDMPKMTSSHLRADDERYDPRRDLPTKTDKKTHLMPFLVTKRKKLAVEEDARRLPLKIDKKTSRKISKFQFRKKDALP